MLTILHLKPTSYKLIFIVLFLVVTIFSVSCSLANYQGLRLETTRLESSDIEISFPRIVCLGDSVTFGWNLSYEKSYPFLLEKKLEKQYPGIMVINSGIGGQTIIDGFNRLENDLFYFNPQVAIINFGLNDAFILIEEDSENIVIKNNIDIDAFSTTYRQLIEKILENNIEIIIMNTNPIIPGLLWKNKDIAHKQEESYRLYNQEVKNIAEDYDLIFFDIWKGFTDRGELDALIQSDGVHPSEVGLTLISEILFTTLSSADLASNKKE